MIAVIKKNIVFKCTTDCQKFFELLKKRFTITLILAYSDLKKEYIVETNASDNVSVRVLSQYSDDRFFHLIVFFSQKYLS